MVAQGIWAKLATFRRQYFQLVDPSQLRWLESNTLKNPEVQSWIYKHLFDTKGHSTLPPDRYRLRVLKVLISKLEKAIEQPDEDAISDDLMEALSSIVGSNILSESESAQQKAYVTYAFPRHNADDGIVNDNSVTLLESRSVVSSSGTTGLRTWEAALLLGQFLSTDRGKTMVNGKRVFELGAGTGMLSILCAKHLGVSGIVSTDGDEAVVDAIKTNIFLNVLDASRTAVNTAALRWGRSLSSSTFLEDYGMDIPEVLVGADVTYDSTIIPALVSSMREFFELNAALQILVAATIRNEQTFETFLNACRRNRFTLQQIDFAPLPEPLQDGPFYPTATPIQIWRITRAHTTQDPFAF
ncbi:uncharacterized protein N0V89_003876 [Didymosphaeria variabile]|uniref:S-adenosyl-L-methionine-dependent methyltransferase n=1 Tax=Didymosphaeria variabile TaxID=1932322 RepID=A0A9W9CCN2_9PLEO|nr:uncharacterized protein N0V89_003876 [Didymosphaeria variabile]KAJ4355855.1 hypothetical protein N0V89_003876 [Didymosphaeria variabile]